MMGDRDFRTVIKNSIESVGKELDYKIDIENNIHRYTNTPYNEFHPSISPDAKRIAKPKSKVA